METLAGKEAGIFLGMEPRAVGSAGITAAIDKDIGEAVIGQQTAEKEATEQVTTTHGAKRKAIANAQDYVKNASEKLENYGSSNAVYKEALAALKGGANTGQIYDMLPTFDVDSILLENVASRAGFEMAKSGGGIITDADMKFGLATAIPRNLPPKELEEFLKNKITGQDKIANQLREAVMFLDGTENTIRDWYRHSKKNKDITQLDDEELFK